MFKVLNTPKDVSLEQEEKDLQRGYSPSISYLTDIPAPMIAMTEEELHNTVEKIKRLVSKSPTQIF